MEDTVKGKTLKKIAESLGRFADVRETAKEPRDRIILQADGTAMKFIAGSISGTLVVTAHATDQRFRAIVPARNFLQALKDTNAKQDYRIVDLNQGFEIGATLMGDRRVDFLRLTKSLPVIMLPPDLTAESQGKVSFEADELKELGALMVEVADYANFPVTVAGKIYTKNQKVRFVANTSTRFAAREFDGAYELFGTIGAEFLEAARGIGDSVMQFWTDGKVTLENDMYRAVGKYDMLTVGGPLDFAPGKVERVQHKAVVNRTEVVKSIREYAKLDNYGRVALQLNDDGIKVLPFDKSNHGWYARGENLLKVLTALSAKQVGIGLRKGVGQPINVRVPEWSIEIAPVELSTKK